MMCVVVPNDCEMDCSQKPKLHMLTEEFMRSAWPSSCHPPTALSGMNVNEVAIWIRVFGGLKGWAEAKAYSVAFESNGVCGNMLTCLNVETLRDKLGVRKLGHRLEIVEAIEKNELTLMNPTIMSLRPNMSFRM